MTKELERKAILESIVKESLVRLKKGQRPYISGEHQGYLNYHFDHVLEIISKLSSFTPEEMKQKKDFVSICREILTNCLANLRYAYERKEKKAIAKYNQLNQHIKKEMATTNNLIFWHGLFNIFHTEELPIDEEVKESFAKIAENNAMPTKDMDPAGAFRNLIEKLQRDMPDATEYELADMFFSQLAVSDKKSVEMMMRSFFIANTAICEDIAILFLLHPDRTVRNYALMELYALFAKKKLSVKNFSKLLKIRDWWPVFEQPAIDRFITAQRQLGANAKDSTINPVETIILTEIDGAGAQAFAVEFKRGTNYLLCGGVLKKDVGFRGLWFLPPTSKQEINHIKAMVKEKSDYQGINRDYLDKIISHYIAVGHKNSETPSLVLLQLSDMIGANNWTAHPIDYEKELSALLEDIHFSQLKQDEISCLIKNGDKLYNKITFSHSWFEADEVVDAIIKKHIKSLIKEKPAELETVYNDIFENVLEPRRQEWFERFIWTALWLKNSLKKPDDITLKSIIIFAKRIHEAAPLNSLPFMQEICKATAEIGKSKFLYEAHSV